MDDLISVVMSTYNETEEELRSSINSILKQTYENIEFIIVNDNPNNESLSRILSAFELYDSRIVVLENDTNRGLVYSLNRGIKYAKGQFIARMDADDISAFNRLEIEVDYLKQHPDCAMVSGNKEDIDKNGILTGTRTFFSVKDIDIARIIPYGTIIVHPTVMYRREVVIKLGLYRELKGCEDYDLWLRMISAGLNIHIISKPILLQYRIRENSVTRRNYSLQSHQSLYIYELYKERKKGGVDSYSENANIDIVKFASDNSAENEAFNEFFCELEKKERLSRLVWCLFRGLFYSNFRMVLFRMIKYKVLMKKYNQEE